MGGGERGDEGREDGERREEGEEEVKGTKEEGDEGKESIERKGTKGEGEVRVAVAHRYESSLQQAKQSPACIFL